MQSPCVHSTDIGVAFTADTIWTVTHNGGTHCTWIADGHGCPLPEHHHGDHIPATTELLTAGMRLHPCATLNAH